MKSVYTLNKENRKECRKFLEKCSYKRYTFVTYNEDEQEWEKDGEYVDVGDVAPFVPYDGDYLKEYVVTDIYIENVKVGGPYSNISRDVLMVRLVDPECPANKRHTYDVEFSDLYGVSECYIYEMMIDLGLDLL